MTLQKTDYNGEPIDIDDRKNYEQRLMMLVSGINGTYKTDYFGMEKAMSIRFNSANYPRVKALADLSGNSLNSVVNDLVEVAYGMIMENSTEENSDKLFKRECLIREEWTNDYQKKDKK